MRIRHLLTTGATTVAALALTAAPSMAAGNAHFLAPHTSASANSPSLTVSFKEAGLESGSVETVVASAHLDATYQCVNKGGHNPDDPKKTTISSDISQSGQFTAGKNGNLVGSLTLAPPAASSVLDCPSGQKATLTVVSWSDISVTDETSGAYLAIPGTFSWGSPIN